MRAAAVKDHHLEAVELRDDAGEVERLVDDLLRVESLLGRHGGCGDDEYIDHEGELQAEEP